MTNAAWAGVPAKNLLIRAIQETSDYPETEDFPALVGKDNYINYIKTMENKALDIERIVYGAIRHINIKEEDVTDDCKIDVFFYKGEFTFKIKL